MKTLHTCLAFAALLVLCATPASAAGSKKLHDLSAGNPNAPITITDYASLTCSHCADFFTNVLPEIEKKYVDTGKIRFIYRDFPIDGYSLRAAALVQCMPESTAYAFVKTLFKNMGVWVHARDPEASLIQFAQMAGLETEKAKACISDADMLDALIERRKEASEKYNIEATPTFVVNNGEDKIVGAVSVAEFSAKLDKLLAKKK